MKWTQEEFVMIQNLARRHDIHCRLRVAMVTGDDANGTRICNCNGKLGEPGRPREQTLADVLSRIYTATEEA